MGKKLSHIDERQKANMVDVGDKGISKRTATARSVIELSRELMEQFDDGELHVAKGPVLQTAVIAGIMAAKRTHELIPMCHPLPLSGIDITIDPLEKGGGFEILATVKCEAKTGVEMEALTAASIAALTIYDMCKSYGHQLKISETKLLEKRGGKSDYKDSE